jgi:hypothetical protein
MLMGLRPRAVWPDRHHTPRRVPGSRRPPPHSREDPQAPEVQAGSGGDDSDRGPGHRVRTLPPNVTGCCRPPKPDQRWCSA